MSVVEWMIHMVFTTEGFFEVAIESSEPTTTEFCSDPLTDWAIKTTCSFKKLKLL